MIITTAFDETPLLLKQAKQLADEFSIEFVSRNKRTIKAMLESVDSQIFVTNSLRGLSFYELGKEEVFFHPNMAKQRINQLKNQRIDSMIQACGLETGMTFFDGTAGLLADSLVASFVGANITACEKSFPLYLILREGIKFYQENHPEMAKLFERITLIHKDNLEVLKKLPDESFDVVYFDFMFDSTIQTSIGIQVIKSAACADWLSQVHVKEALRVAKRCVVVKSTFHRKEELLDLGFEIRKENTKKRFFFARMVKVNE